MQAGQCERVDEQAERIVQWFPPQERLEPLIILFCRVIDLENFSECYKHLGQPIENPPKECQELIRNGKPCVEEEFPMRECEFLHMVRRLGALNAFNPYNPDFFWELDCKLGAKADERVLEVTPEHIHQKSPMFVGSASAVRDLQEFLKSK